MDTLTHKQYKDSGIIFRNTLEKITSLIPDTDSYKQIHRELRCMSSSLGYVAPELLPRKWCDLYTILHTHIPINEKTGPEEGWEMELVEYWQTANKDFSGLQSSKVVE